MAGFSGSPISDGWKYIDPQESVLDKDLTTPPASPTKGDRYIVAATASGAWAGKEKYIAEYTGLSWTFITPTIGFETYVEDEDREYSYTSGLVWVPSSSLREVLSFDKDTVTQVLKVLSAGTIIKCATVNVTTAFVGTKTITIGFPADTDEITGTVIDLTKINVYKFDSYRTTTATESLTVYFSGTASAGAGKIIVELI